jgi:hypothetical protein
MEEELCDIMGGGYLGGAACGVTDPCERFRIPGGFEIVEVTPGMEAFRRRHPRINNCGQIVVHIGSETSSWEAEIYLYDNGLLTQVTNDGLSNVFPDINDKGTITWDRGLVPANREVVLLRGGELAVLGDGRGPSINNSDHVVWCLPTGAGCNLSEYESDIYYYYGTTVQKLFGDGLSNVSARVNDHDDIVWERALLPCGGGVEDWTSEIMLYAAGSVTPLPSSADPPQVQGPDVDNHPRVAWCGTIGVEVWETGVTTLLASWPAGNPGLNDRGDVAYHFKETDEPWQVWLYRDGRVYRISNDVDIQNLIRNDSPALNNSGETAWQWKHGGLAPSGTRFMRRIRNGDVDFDGDRDLDDFIPMPNCWTDPVPTAGLCECRFLDIDHDRDIDYDDFDLFMRVYTGPLEDCNQNEILDLHDLIEGTSKDCNLNGIPDECDIESGFSQDIDGTGVPDECIAPIPAVSEWGLVILTLVLLAGGSVVITRRPVAGIR